MCAAAAPFFGFGCAALARGQVAADLVVTNARIYTADGARSMAEALAVREGKIVFVGSAAQGASFAGPKTTVERLEGKLVLPGLIDSHIHPDAEFPTLRAALDGADSDRPVGLLGNDGRGEPNGAVNEEAR